MGEYDKIKTNYAIFKKSGEVSKMQNSRFLISSISKFVQFSKTSNSLRAAPTSVRFLASDVHNDEKSIESCGKAKTLDKKDKILREKTPIGKLEELEGASHPFQEKEPLKPFPGGVNPKTGEVGGPKGPEPTRFGDWERKGRVTDF